VTDVNDPLSRLRVMLVEDDPQIARLLQMMLSEMEVKLVHAAKDGAEALRFLGEHEGGINTVICDWHMPNMTGIELLRQVRSVDQKMCFVMVTGEATMDHVLQARCFNVSAFVAKPFYAETIRDKLGLVAGRLGP
jgi:DNA-binding NtrC family response regulator